MTLDWAALCVCWIPFASDLELSLSPSRRSVSPMHAPSHSAALPAGVDPIPVPDTEREAEMLLILLDAGLYPRIQPKSSERQLSGTAENGREGLVTE